MSTRKHEKNKEWFYPEPLVRFLPPKKSTVKLWIRGEWRWWNPENKVEYP